MTGLLAAAHSGDGRCATGSSRAWPGKSRATAGTGGTSLFHVFGYAGLFFSLVLILRVIIAITRDGI